MNWGRVKTVLIILFLCTDIFLLATYFTSKYESSKIPEEVISSTISVLEKNGIALDRELIPQYMPKIKNAEAENVISDYESFAKKFLGNDIYRVDFGYESTRGKVTFFGDRFNFIANPVNSPLLDIATINDEKSAKDVSGTVLEAFGFNLDNASCKPQKTENGYVVTFENMADSLPIFNSQISITFENHLVSSISGTWFNETESQGGNNSLKSIASVLIDFIPEAPEGITINSMELGYNIFDKELYHKSAVLIPVWKINCDNGESYLLDARDMQ